MTTKTDKRGLIIPLPLVEKKINKNKIRLKKNKKTKRLHISTSFLHHIQRAWGRQSVTSVRRLMNINVLRCQRNELSRRVNTASSMRLEYLTVYRWRRTRTNEKASSGKRVMATVGREGRNDGEAELRLLSQSAFCSTPKITREENMFGQ